MRQYIRCREWLDALRDDEGQGLVEYGLIIVLISIACFASLGLVGGSISNQLYGQIVQTVQNGLGP